MISIVIPTYNRCGLLPEAVESCLNQTFTDIEVIIVDDGSTDGTGASVRERIAKKWGAKVKYVRQAHAGASAARNRGLAVARGDYIQFLDSDDILLPRKLEVQLASMAVFQGGYSGCSSFGRAGRRVSTGVQLDERIGAQCVDPVAYMREMCVGAAHVMQTAAPLWRRDFLLAGTPWAEDISYGDDWEYYTRLLARAGAMGFVPEELFHLLGHDGPRLGWGRLSREQLLSALRAQQSVMETMKRAGCLDGRAQEGLLRRARSTYFALLGVGSRGDVWDFERWLIRASRHPGLVLLPHVLVSTRRLLGNWSLLCLFRTYTKFRQWLGARVSRG